MIPWQLLDSAQIPGKEETLRLYRRGGEFSIRVDGAELMNSRIHGSEEAMAELACGRIAAHPSPRVLIGGLGMGYTLAAALKRLAAESRVMVAELVPAVVTWNRGLWRPWRATPLMTAGSRFGKPTSQSFSGRSNGPTMPSCWTWIMAPGA